MEMYKVSKGLSPSIVTELFKHRDKQHNVRTNAESTIPAKRTVYRGYKSTSLLGSKIWNALPDMLKKALKFLNQK